jgi:hypothetical protein
MGLAGAQLRSGFVEGRRAERFVTVRGLSEREVKADTAIWPIRFTVPSDDLPTAYVKSEADKKTILTFLTAGGLKADEIEIGQIDVSDSQARAYGGGRAAQRFIVGQQLTVHTKQVDQVALLATRIAELVKSGVVLASNHGIAYRLTEINAIKPALLAEATKNARASAAQFAADSGASVGQIRKATHGALSIVPLEEVATGGGEEGGFFQGGAERSIKQKVRVVMTVEFLLER